MYLRLLAVDWNSQRSSFVNQQQEVGPINLYYIRILWHLLYT